ncbi:MAG: asparagine synthase (glutamine-hydrolyzing) [Phycisphaerae bacterium]
MCGIAGIWGSPTPDRLEAMGYRLRHRGPDEDGCWTDPANQIGFAHRRLAIIDIEGGQQPVFSEDRSVATVFNGEIYNYKELRAELIGRGHTFTTNTDTEVVVHLYEELGPDLAQKLRGMFAIALWDEGERQLVLIRDRVGKKPLYYSEQSGEFLFASEIKGIVAGTGQSLSLDEQSLSDYLAWGMVPAPATIYQQVRSLEPGQRMVVRNRQVVEAKRYWRLEMLPKLDLNADQAVEQVDGLLREAVRLRLRSDVPVGAFLSGGIDSGLITALAAEQCSEALITVTVGFDEAGFDERPLARLVAERYGTDHHEVVIKADVTNDLAAIAAAYDQPFGDSSAVPSYYVARAARPFVKVVLNGDGGDELFAGYRRYVAARINRLLRWTDGAVGRQGWRLLSALLPGPRRFRSAYGFGHRLVRGMARDPVDRYLAWSVDQLTESQKRVLCGLENGGGWLDGAEPSDRLARGYLTELSGAGPVDRMLGADFAGILPNDLLVKMDTACMAHGLEARSPLLDQVLIETVSRYPETVKLPGWQTKPLLRRLSQKYLPPAIQKAPKRGFEVPVVRWLRGELKPMCRDVLLSRNGLLAQRMDRSALERMIEGKDGLDPGRWGRRMWSLLMLGMWDQHVMPRSAAQTNAR